MTNNSYPFGQGDEEGETKIGIKIIKEKELYPDRRMDGVVSVNRNVTEDSLHPKRRQIINSYIKKEKVDTEYRNAPESTNQKELPKSSHKKFYVLITLLILFVALATLSAFYFYKKSKIEPVSTEDNNAQAQLEETIEHVGKIALLPPGDEPVLAVVSDPLQLKNDAFFVDSVVGDRVLIYPNIGRAFLYRPSTGKIINIISFLPNSPESENFATSTATTTNKVR